MRGRCVAYIRHPVNRFRSAWGHAANALRGKSVDEWLETVSHEAPDGGIKMMFTPQTWWLDGPCEIYRLEWMDEDWDDLVADLGLRSDPLPGPGDRHRNEKLGPKPDLATDELATVTDFYKDDLELWLKQDHHFDPSSGSAMTGR